MESKRMDIDGNNFFFGGWMYIKGGVLFIVPGKRVSKCYQLA